MQLDQAASGNHGGRSDGAFEMIRIAANSLLVACVVALAAPVQTLAVENRDGVAVIIGNKNYQGGLPSVDFADRDAEAFKRFVVDVLGYDPENIIDLRDATTAQLMATFGNWEMEKGRLWRYLDPEGGSDVVVFYSGRGV